MKVRGDDLSTPRQPGIGLNLQVTPDTFGRLTERIARFLGTGRYLAMQTVLVIVWISLNVFAVALRWDPYPFILLNLAFSTQAAYAAPLILLAQNRQESRDRAMAERDRETTTRILSDTEFLSRELAAIRLNLEDVPTSQDLENAMWELQIRLDRLIDPLTLDQLRHEKEER